MVLTPLAERARLLFHLQALASLVLFWVPMCGVAAVAWGVAMSWLQGIIGGCVVLFALFLVAVWYPSFAFDRWGYAVTDDEVLVARGVFVRRITAIPTTRIQHVDTRQGPLEQWFGLARVQIHTASGVGGDGVIPGLELAVAEELRDRLVEVEGDDGV